MSEQKATQTYSTTQLACWCIIYRQARQAGLQVFPPQQLQLPTFYPVLGLQSRPPKLQQQSCCIRQARQHGYAAKQKALLLTPKHGHNHTLHTKAANHNLHNLLLALPKQTKQHSICVPPLTPPAHQPCGLVPTETMMVPAACTGPSELALPLNPITQAHRGTKT